MQEIIIEASGQRANGIERLAADRSREATLAILALMRLWKTLRDDAT
jgi:hypothetical protein